MKVEDLVGSRVWMKADQFRSVPGVISSVAKVVDLGDFQASIDASVFKVALSSGDFIEVAGPEISKFDHGVEAKENASCS